MELKKLSKEALPKALAKAERYRFLNDPSAAESICRDVLAVEPEHQSALVMLILSLTDQFSDPMHRINIKQPQELVVTLTGDYQRAYYSGIICERWAKAQLHRGSLGAGGIAYEFLLEAMDHYKKAQALKDSDNDETVLRWNSCVRCIESHRLTASSQDDQHTLWHD